ncbi:MAG: mannose-6-phosphate isomerase, class I [Actinomycetia bacterium]|nr:mannose-6-phosphate isomerase, class I [Actinomycetes bacterium]
MQRLTGTIQNYAWGDRRFIAELQSRPVTGDPEAELWLGTHPSAPSILDDGRSLADAIASDPLAALGVETAERFGELPFLAKVLAAAQPLSIQGHPSAQQARTGFDRENRQGIALDSPTRTYRDPNHKPELICALTPFQAKCGFRPLAATRELFALLDGSGLDEVGERLAGPGTEAEILATTLAWLVQSPASQGADLAAAAVAAAESAPRGGQFDAALDWTAQIAALHPGDVGVVVALLLNHVSLEPNQAVFLGAGNLHAYLEGAGIELMANSDNVVRGGLTPKHIDINELLSVVDCTPIDPLVQQANGAAHTFNSPVSEFSLSRLEIDGESGFSVSGPEIVIATQGHIKIVQGQTAATLGPGESAWVPASGGDCSASGSGILFRATVGHL